MNSGLDSAVEEALRRWHRGRAVNKRHFDDDTARHPRMAEYKKAIVPSDNDYTESGDDLDSKPNTNEFLGNLFRYHDITRIVLSFSDRLTREHITSDEVEPYKEAIGIYFDYINRKYRGRRLNKSDNRLRAELLSTIYMKYFGMDSRELGLMLEANIDVITLVKEDFKGRRKALSDGLYDKLKINLVERYVIGRNVSPTPLDISIGNQSSGTTLGDYLPPQTIAKILAIQ